MPTSQTSVKRSDQREDLSDRSAFPLGTLFLLKLYRCAIGIVKLLPQIRLREFCVSACVISYGAGLRSYVCRQGGKGCLERCRRVLNYKEFSALPSGFPSGKYALAQDIPYLLVGISRVTCTGPPQASVVKKTAAIKFMVAVFVEREMGIEPT